MDFGKIVENKDETAITDYDFYELNCLGNKSHKMTILIKYGYEIDF